jgi:hypothetical protein
VQRRIEFGAPLVAAGLAPKPASDLDRVDAGRLPPCLLVAGAVHRPVVPAAERHREFIARFAAERARLHEPQVVRVGRLAAADEACLLGDLAKMLAVAVPARGGDGAHA